MIVCLKNKLVRECIQTIGEHPKHTMFAVIAQPASKCRPLIEVSVLEAGRPHETEDRMGGHKTPLLLGAVDHAVDKVTITDTRGGIIQQFKRL